MKKESNEKQPQMDQPLSEKDGVKQAEERMRSNAEKAKSKPLDREGGIPKKTS